MLTTYGEPFLHHTVTNEAGGTAQRPRPAPGPTRAGLPSRRALPEAGRGALTAGLAAELATAVGVTPTGEPRCSEAAVVAGTDLQGRGVIVRVSRDDENARRYVHAAAALRQAAAGTAVHAPTLLDAFVTGDGWLCCTWERFDTDEVTAEAVGWALTRLERVPRPTAPVVFSPVPPRPPETIFSPRLISALWEQARRRWQTWCSMRPATGWTHGDWVVPGDNMAVNGGDVYVWDLGSAGWGPLGWDVAGMWMNARFDNTGMSVACRGVDGYRQGHGCVDAEMARHLLEPAVAAMSAVACAQRARYRPELTGEAAKRIHGALYADADDYGSAHSATAPLWTPIGAIANPAASISPAASTSPEVGASNG